MADELGEYDFDLELYCIVCDRQIDPSSASAAVPTDPHRSPRASPRLALPAAPNPTPSSSKSYNPPPGPSAPAAAAAAAAPAATKLKRSGSGHSATSNHASHGTGLKRNKSLGKVHHAAGGAHRSKNHSHANLHALAPMTAGTKKVPVTAVGPAAEREKGKERERERERDKDKDREPQPASVSTLYCSVECQRIDEARNQLALAHLGSSDSPAPPPFPLPSPASDDFYDGEEPYASMIRRRSSGISSTGSTSYAMSSTGEHGLSPIMSAAPTSNPTPYLDSSGFPFPSVSTSSSPFARSSPQSAMVSHPSNSSLNSLPSQQSYQGPAPLLNFSSRRQSRGAHSSGAYSYRPSLMERVHSTDSQDSNASERAASRTARSLSIGGGGLSAGLFNRVRSMEGLASMGRSDSESSDREGRQSQTHRPPSALSSLRSMTPISNGAPTSSSGRPRPPLANMRYSEPASSNHSGIDERPPTARIASDSLASSESRSRSRSRKPPQAGRLPSRTRSRPPPTTSPLHGGSDPPAPIVGSLPATRSRGLSLGSPTSTTSLLRPVPAAPDSLLANRRTSSSASLALLGSSLSKSYDHRPGGSLAAWSGLKRTDSTAGLSGLNAVGEMSGPSTSLSSLPPSSSSTASTFVLAPSTYQPRPHPSHAPTPSNTSRHPPPHHDRPRRPSSSHSHPHSSPSSATSSFGPSHSSVRTSSSSRRSTAASSDHHWQGIVSSSYGSTAAAAAAAAGKASSPGMYRTRSGSSSRPERPSTGTSSTSSNGMGGGGGSTGGGGGGGGGGGSNATMTNSSRIKQGGLTMTPSSTNLNHHTAPPSPGGGPRTHSSLAPAIPASSTTTTTTSLQGGGGGGGLGPAVASGTTAAGGGSRTWSWTNLHVPTYQALDVSEYRANKERSATAAAQAANVDPENQNGRDFVVGAPTTLASQPKKDRKRLFYFSDQND